MLLHVVRDSPRAESLCCVLEQDALSTVKYWFNPDLSRHDWEIVDWDVDHQNESTETMSMYRYCRVIGAYHSCM